MDRYEGQKDKPDRIVGGGAYVRKNKRGHEVCNFLPVGDRVYGHVETLHRKIRIEHLGASHEGSVNGVDVIWTATHPEEGGRRVIGWYLDATVYRERQAFAQAPTKQHKKDGIDSFRIEARASNAFVLDLHERELRLERAKGWMGHTPWWAPEPKQDKVLRQFIAQVKKQIASGSGARQILAAKQSNGRGSPAAKDPYVRYIEEYETVISPLHHKLQEQFETYLKQIGRHNYRANERGVDLRYVDPILGDVLVEIKPADISTCRFAIRTAIGQLFDYRQSRTNVGKLLIIVGSAPDQFDKDLALSNGVGIGFPKGATFEIEWPGAPNAVSL